jgi:hypothetical protein
MDDISDQFNQFKRKLMEQFRSSHGGPLSEIFRDKMQNLPVAIGTNDLQEILRSGQYKNAFHFPIDEDFGFEKTGGDTDHKYRREVEKNFFGIPEDASANVRPQYGILADKKALLDNDYGSQHIIMGRGYKDPVTFTIGDSFDPDAVLIRSRTDVGKDALDAAVSSRIKRAIFDAELGVEKSADDWSQYLGKMTRIMESPKLITGPIGEILSGQHTINQFANPYLEAQMHGPVDIENDVRGFVVPTIDEAEKLSKTTNKPVSVLNPNTGRLIGPNFGLSHALPALGLLSDVADIAAQASGGKPSWMEEAGALQQMRAEQFRRGNTAAPPATPDVLRYLSSNAPEA